MPKQENTAINDLIGVIGRGPVDEIDDQPLVRTTVSAARLPATRLRPAPPSASLAPTGAPIAPLSRRRAPAATPSQVPLRLDYAADSEDAATTVDPPRGWAAAPPPVAQPTPPPLPPMPSMPHLQPVQPLPQVQPVLPVPAWAAAPPVRPAYPAPHEPPIYYQAPYPDQTLRVRAMPLEPRRSLGSEILEWVAKLWIPFVALGVIAMSLGVYRLVTDGGEGPEPVAAVAAVAAAEPPTVMTAQPVESTEVPETSLWRPTKPQPTIAPRVDSVAATEPASGPEPASEPEPASGPEPASEPEPEPASGSEIEIEMASGSEPAPAQKPTARASSGRSSSRRAAKRASAKRASEQRATQLGLAELAPVPAKPKVTKRETSRVVAIAGAKPMKIGAAPAAPKKGTGTLSVSSTPPTLIYVDGRNTGMMTPKTLSLPEGSHKITLLSPKERIAKTIAVEIEAGTSSTLTKTFTK